MDGCAWCSIGDAKVAGLFFPFHGRLVVVVVPKYILQGWRRDKKERNRKERERDGRRRKRVGKGSTYM